MDVFATCLLKCVNNNFMPVVIFLPAAPLYIRYCVTGIILKALERYIVVNGVYEIQPSIWNLALKTLVRSLIENQEARG